MIRKEAAKVDVKIVTPREFFDGKIDEEAETEWYLSRFREEVPLYCRERKDGLERWLQVMYKFQDVIFSMHAPVEPLDLSKLGLVDASGPA